MFDEMPAIVRLKLNVNIDYRCDFLLLLLLLLVVVVTVQRVVQFMLVTGYEVNQCSV